MDIRHIQEFLRHKHLSSTQIYTRVAIADLKRIMQKHHPREKRDIKMTFKINPKGG
jgi:integrase/recombinase XerD